ncbi:cytochrome P450 27C1-like [Oculina patagonica]
MIRADLNHKFISEYTVSRLSKPFTLLIPFSKLKFLRLTFPVDEQMAYVGRFRLTAASFSCLNKNVFLPRTTKISMLNTVASNANEQNTDEAIKKFTDLPGPLSLPLIKASWTAFLGERGEPLGKRLLSLQADSIEKYGRIFLMDFPGMKSVSLADPLDVATVLRNEPKHPRRFNIPIFDYYRETRGKEPGVFFANGTEWYNYRSVISKRMLRPKEVADYAVPFNEIVTDFIERVKNIREPPGSEKEYEVQGLDNELFKWSFESVAEMLFDKRFGCLEPEVNKEAQTFIQAINVFLEEMMGTNLYPIWLIKIYKPKQVKKMFDSFDTMYEYAEMFIQRRIKEIEEQEQMQHTGRESEKKMSFFEFLLSSGKLSKDDLLGSVIDVLFAGVDTTSNTMQWVLYMMAKNPDKQEILRQEVLSVLGDQNQASPATIAQMPYLKAWVRETLRLYPVLSIFGRIASEDLILSGYHIPAGTQLDFLVYFMSHDEDVFPDPEEFKPERWLREQSNKFNQAKEVFASIPFGFGTRMCIGRRVAELELHLLLARIVQQFEIQYPPDAEMVQPFIRGITIPDRPVRAKFVDRKL